MSFDRVEYPQWVAPAEDGGALVWPSPPHLLAEARQNNAMLGSSQAMIQNVPLAEVRREMRRLLGQAEDDRLLIATGHQAELYHPGVWAKDVVIHLAAEACGGMACHFAVDTDEPKHLDLRWPGARLPLTDDPAMRIARWCGQVATPTTAHLATLEARLAEAETGWRFKSLLRPFLDEISAEPTSAPMLLAQAVTDACNTIDQSLGLQHRAILTSPIWSNRPYLLLAHHLLARAGDFAATYNAALADFRRENGVKNPGRPMPDMRINEDAIEVPFWIDSLSDGGRRRGMVHISDGRIALAGGDGSDFPLDPALDGWEAARRLGIFLQQQNLRLSPRALTLTTCLRLLAADQFVHGIGGGLYDQVADRIITTHFGLPRPYFAVATATLLFPESAGCRRVCLQTIRQAGHKLRHNLLGEQKMRMVEQIAAAPRRSSHRRELYAEMHRQLGNAQSDPRLEAWRRSFALAEEQDVRDGQIFDRELFYAIQPAERLRRMIEVYAEGFGLSYSATGTHRTFCRQSSLFNSVA